MRKSTYAASAQAPQPTKRYPSDCTDAEWTIIQPFTIKTTVSGRKRRVDMREIVNGIFYRVKTGCQWRMLPKDFPNWHDVWYYYHMWTEDGTWEHMNDLLRQRLRMANGRDPEPSLAMIDSQSVPSTEAGGERGYDGAKKVKGRKRHILVDILGLLLLIYVHSADIVDVDGAEVMFPTAQRKFPRLRKIIADSAYGWNNLVDTVRRCFHFVLELVVRDRKRKGWYVLPKRWIVERTFGWFGRYRLLSREYEHLTASSEADVYIASIRIMLQRLSRMKQC